MNANEIISESEKNGSVKYLWPKDLEAALPELEKAGFFVAALEASERRGDYEVPIIWLSLIGADGEENWENHFDLERNKRLVIEKIHDAKKTGLPIFYQMWLDTID